MDPLFVEENKLKDLEHEISLVRAQIYKLQQGECEEEYEDDEEFAQVLTENVKLKHRLVILQRAIENEMKQHHSKPLEMISIIDHLTKLFTDAIRAAYPEMKDMQAVITPVKIAKFGDYACSSAVALANILKGNGKNEKPMDVAKSIHAKIGQSGVIDRIQVENPGYLNVFLNKAYGTSMISSMLKNGVTPPKVDKQHVLVDFSSPNIAKEMHVGHLRSTIIGDSICRLLEFLGHDVLRINHVGDWGTQFGMLIAHLEDKFPNFLEQTPSIGDLQSLYKESKKRFDEDEDFKKRAYNCVVKLQSGDKKSIVAWNIICDVSRKEFQKIYDRLGVTLIERGESFYHTRMGSLVKELEGKGFLEEDEGRKIMWAEGESVPLTVVKSDGGYTYDTSDMAAIKQRLEEEKCDWLIYVTDSGQATHFKTIFGCAKRAGILDPKKHRVDHVGFGVVLGEDGKKFKTRSGDTVRLADLLDEGLKRALDKLIQKKRDEVLTPEELKAAQESLAYSCIKYTDLLLNRTSAYLFSFDKMLDDRGNTAVYLLYAYIRIKSIGRNLRDDFERNYDNIIQTTAIPADHEKEWKLIKVLLKFSDIILKISKELYLHHLCEYAFEVSVTFTEFYNDCYCIERDSEGKLVKINYGRVLLCEATAMILGKCFEILGITPLSKM